MTEGFISRASWILRNLWYETGGLYYYIVVLYTEVLFLRAKAPKF